MLRLFGGGTELSRPPSRVLVGPSTPVSLCTRNARTGS